jgi:hypothetical protein
VCAKHFSPDGFILENLSFHFSSPSHQTGLDEGVGLDWIWENFALVFSFCWRWTGLIGFGNILSFLSNYLSSDALRVRNLREIDYFFFVRTIADFDGGVLMAGF